MRQASVCSPGAAAEQGVVGVESFLGYQVQLLRL